MTDEDGDFNTTLRQLTAEIVAAFVGNNALPASDLPALIAEVYGALSNAAVGKSARLEQELKPAVPVRRSVSADAITCLYCGKEYKSLKRHIFAQHGVKPDQYRSAWELNSDYPMVAPRYAEARSTLAKKLGFGQRR